MNKLDERAKVLDQLPAVRLSAALGANADVEVSGKSDFIINKRYLSDTPSRALLLSHGEVENLVKFWLTVHQEIPQNE